MKSQETCENVTILPDEGIDTIHAFSKLNISGKSSQSSTCDQSSVAQLMRRKSVSGSSPASHGQYLPTSYSPGITQDKIMDQAGKGLSVFKDSKTIQFNLLSRIPSSTNMRQSINL